MTGTPPSEKSAGGVSSGCGYEGADSGKGGVMGERWQWAIGSWQKTERKIANCQLPIAHYRL
jgi:hypothetical protein